MFPVPCPRSWISQALKLTAIPPSAPTREGVTAPCWTRASLRPHLLRGRVLAPSGQSRNLCQRVRGLRLQQAGPGVPRPRFIRPCCVFESR